MNTRKSYREYRVKGLTCGHCAQKMEHEIQQLQHGESAALSYSSGKLKLEAGIDLEKVQHILKAEGAYLSEVEASGDAHRRQIGLLVLAAMLFAAGLLLEPITAQPLVIALYLTATLVSGYTTFWRGLRNLTRLKFTMDTLMTIALIGAIAIGEWKEATLVALLFGLNELLEGMGMEKARRSVETLLKSAPKEAVVIHNGVERIVPVSALQPGDLVLVKAGEKIPSDGQVEQGISSVNEAAITGEAMPIDKQAGAAVYGGSINNEGVLRIRIAKAYKDSSLARIVHLVEEAQETKTPTELFINKFASYYTPLILVVALLVMLAPPLLLNGEWSKWLYQGLAVLIVGCPCALILSSPIAIVSGIARNARNGILIKGGVFLEQLGKLDTIAFDKTGTLTEGAPTVEQMLVYDEQRFYQVATALASASSHPLASAIRNKLEQHDASALGADPAADRAGAQAVAKPEEVQTIAGAGVHARLNGEHYWLGNEKAIAHVPLDEQTRAACEQLKADGLTLVLVADRTHVLGMFGLADEIRKESRTTIRDLHQIGIRQTVMLTGDHAQTAAKVAVAAGVSSYFASLLPEHKVAHIKKLRQSGKVAMIGDGINDAPALAAADLGIAMGKGTDSAIETADVVLMQNHLGKLPEAVTIARRVNRIIRFNITVALGLKLIALLLTIPGWLTLWIAILADMGATVLVTLVSLTLLLPAARQAPAPDRR